MAVTSKDFVDAIVSGDVVTVKKMLKSSKNKRKFSEDLISLAIKEKQTVIAKFLINHSVTTNKNKEKSLTTALFYAIRRKNLKIVKSLVKMGANVNSKSKSGMTPLMAAAERSNVKILSFILDQKPNVNDVDASGNTALHYVFNYSNKENRPRYSFSHTSEASNDDDRIMLLHKAGADLNAKCSFRNHPHITTILDLAVYVGSIAVVNYLLYNTHLGLKQLDYSKIEQAAFDESALEPHERIVPEYVGLMQEQSSKLQFNLALFILNRHEIGIHATEDTLQKVHDFVKEEEQNSRYFGYYREMEQFTIESRQFLQDKKLGVNGISYWKIMTGNREDLVKLLFNDDFLSQPLLNELEEISNDISFVFHREPLRQNFSYAVGKNKTLRTLIEEVSNLFRTELPYDCCKYIVHLMTNDELKNFIKSLNPPNISDFNF